MIWFKGLHLIILDENQKKWCRKIFRENTMEMAFKLSNKTEILAEPDVRSLNYMNFNSKNFN